MNKYEANPVVKIIRIPTNKKICRASLERLRIQMRKRIKLMYERITWMILVCSE
jgi:hypothetical protein